MALRSAATTPSASSPARTRAAPAACCAWSPKKDRVYVEGANIIKRHTRPRTLRDTQRSQELGGIVEKEGPIHVSNVMLVDIESNEPTRVGITRDGGRRRRMSKRTGKEID